jgi:hypothetical protein
MMPPFQVELSEDDYLALLKSAVKGTPLTRRLVVAPEVTPASRGRYLFQGSRAEGLLLRALALVAAPGAVRAIDRALAAAEKAER